MEFVLAYIGRNRCVLASLDELRSDYILKGMISLNRLKHKCVQYENIKYYSKEQLKQLIFGNNSNEIELRVMEDIDLGFDAEGKFIKLRFPNDFMDGDRLEIIAYTRGLDDAQKLFIEKEEKKKLKYELAGHKYKRHTFNRKYYSFLKGEEEYGDKLKEYAVMKHWEFKNREVQLSDVYLYDCSFCNIDKLSIRHLYGVVDDLTKCSADFMYVTLVDVNLIKDSVVSMHNVHDCSIESTTTAVIHLYNTENLHIVNCYCTHIHFYNYIKKDTLVFSNNEIFINDFTWVNLYFHAGIDIEEFESLLSSMKNVSESFRIYLNKELWNQSDLEYHKNVNYIRPEENN